jgi:hypothetical protein
VNIFAFIFILAALIVFLIEFFISNWKSLIALGLALLSAGWIWQLASTKHTFHF